MKYYIDNITVKPHETDSTLYTIYLNGEIYCHCSKNYLLGCIRGIIGNSHIEDMCKLIDNRKFRVKIHHGSICDQDIISIDKDAIANIKKDFNYFIDNLDAYIEEGSQVMFLLEIIEE